MEHLIIKLQTVPWLKVNIMQVWPTSCLLCVFGGVKEASMDYCHQHVIRLIIFKSWPGKRDVGTQFLNISSRCLFKCLNVYLTLLLLFQNVVKQPEPLASMLTIAEKDKWKRIRNTLTPAFSALKMKQMIPLMNACCDNLIKKLSGVADKEQSVNISK